jgi:hypothetical protein
VNPYFRLSDDLPHPFVFIAMMSSVLLSGYGIVAVLFHGVDQIRGTPEPSNDDDWE